MEKNQNKAKNEKLIEKISKMRYRWWLIAGALIGFAIASPAFVPYTTNSGIVEHPYATWLDLQISNMNCPDGKIWYTGYMRGCVPIELEGNSIASESYVMTYPTKFDEKGMNLEKVEIEK